MRPTLPEDAPEELKNHWAEILASTVTAPYIARSKRAYVHTDGSVFYNSKPKEKNSWGRIDEADTLYFLLDGRIQKATGVGYSYRSGINSAGPDIYSVFRVEGHPEDLFSTDGKPLEKVGSVWMEVEQNGEKNYYASPENNFERCTKDGLTEKQFRKNILEELKAQFPTLSAGSAYFIELGTPPKKVEVMDLGTFIVKDGEAFIRYYDRDKNTESDYTLPEFKEQLKAKADALITPPPTPMSAADEERMKKSLDAAWSGKKSNEALGVVESKSKLFYQGLQGKEFKPEELPTLRATITALPETNPSDSKWKALCMFKLEFYENQNNLEGLLALNTKLKAALTAFNTLEATHTQGGITDNELEDVPTYKFYLNGLIGKIKATTEDVCLKNNQDKITSMKTAFTAGLESKGFEVKYGNSILVKDTLSTLAEYRIILVNGKLTIDLTRFNESPETETKWKAIQSEAAKINSKAEVVLPQ